jgi:hypothetical protein
MFLPLMIGGVLGYVIGNGFGQIKGVATAMVPLTTDPNLEAAYRRAMGPMTEEHVKEYEGMLRLARQHREKYAQRSFIPFYQEVPMPPPSAVAGAFSSPYWPPYGYGYGMYPVELY